MPGSECHCAISREALKALCEWQREALGHAAGRLVQETCLFPDVYYDIHGGGHERAAPFVPMIDGIPLHYLPNTPIECEYKQWQVVEVRGGRRLQRAQIEPNENWRYASLGFNQCLGACVDGLRTGRVADAVGFMGTLFHVLQDATSFVHSLEGPDGTDIFVLDRLVDPPDGDLSQRPSSVLAGASTEFTIEGWRPRLLGVSAAEAAFRLYSAYVEAVLTSRKKLLPLLTCVYADDPAEADRLRADILARAARLCADVAHTILCIAFDRIDPDQAAAIDRVYVSDLKPVREPRGLSLPYRFITMLRDAALDDARQPQPLSLVLDGRTVTFDKGLGTGCHYAYGISWEVPAGVYGTFSCAVGLHSELSRHGDFTAEVCMAGESVARKRCHEADPAARVRCSAHHGGLLELRVTSDAGMGVAEGRVNNIVWGDPVLSK